MFDKPVTIDAHLAEDPLDYVGRDRLLRAFFVLGQASTLTKKKLPQDVLPHSMRRGIIEESGVIHTTSGINKNKRSVSFADRGEMLNSMDIVGPSSTNNAASSSSKAKGIGNGNSDTNVTAALRDSRQGVLVEQGDDKFKKSLALALTCSRKCCRMLWWAPVVGGSALALARLSVLVILTAGGLAHASALAWAQKWALHSA